MELQGQKDWTRQFDIPDQKGTSHWGDPGDRRSREANQFPPQKRKDSFCTDMPFFSTLPLNSHFPTEAHSHCFSQHHVQPQ